FGQDQKRLGFESGEVSRVGGLAGGRDPGFVFAQKLPNGAQQLGLLRFEVEVEDDQRPAGAIVFGESFFDDGADAFEEIGAQGGFGACCLAGVRNHGPALACGGIDAPGQVLFDSNGESGLESAVDAVAPASVVWVAVVGIEHGSVAIEEIERRLRAEDRRGKQTNCDQLHAEDTVYPLEPGQQSAGQTSGLTPSSPNARRGAPSVRSKIRSRIIETNLGRTPTVAARVM